MTDALFLSFLNMSLTASYVIAGVLLVRLALKRAPKVFSYCLWFLVLFRLLCPFTFSSTLSLLPVGEAAIPQDIVYQGVPAVNIGLSVGNQAGNNSLPQATPTASANPLQLWLALGELVWAIGACALLSYGIFSYLRLRRRLKEATLLEGNLWESDRIASPFVLGFFCPKVYLPKGLESQAKECILLHERTHIRRGDHFVKALFFFALCLHWFNPLVWLAFLLMTKDMEMACDEGVMKQVNEDIRASYSASLLAVSCRYSGLLSPLAFGENSVKARIKNVLRYQKPVFGVVACSVVALVILAVVLGTNPIESKEVPPNNSSQSQINGVDSLEAEIAQMAEIWAKALQTRDGEPRYEMMAASAKEKFIAEQKDRAGSENWNFNIGGSSPDIDSWTVSVDSQEKIATILYDTSDSGGETYPQKELVYFGLVDDALKVMDYQDLGIEEAVSYYAPSAEEAAESYIQGLLNRDYHTIAAGTIGGRYTWEGQEIWNTVNISKVDVVHTDIREKKACYELNLEVSDPGGSAFNDGENPRWLWLVKEQLGWQVEGLMSGGAPDEDWWQAPTVSEEISALLEEIMASPKTSSDPSDYIAAHKEAFGELTAMGYCNVSMFYESLDPVAQQGLAGSILHLAWKLQSNIDQTPKGGLGE